MPPCPAPSVDPQTFRPGLYKHYKGPLYRAVALVQHHETREFFVAYVSLTHGSFHLREWASPGKDSWADVGEVRYGHADGLFVGEGATPRFEWVGP